MKKYSNESFDKIPYWKCCNCKWEGVHIEKASKLTDSEIGMRTDVCPVCEHEDFHGINYLGKKKPITNLKHTDFTQIEKPNNFNS